MDQQYISTYFRSRLSTASLGSPWVGGWDLPMIRAALDLHIQGNFQLSSALAIRVIGSSALGLIEQRIAPALGTSREVRSGRPGDAGADTICDDVEAIFLRGSAIDEGVLGAMMATEALMGFAVAQNVYSVSSDGSKQIPRLEPWPTACTRRDQHTGQLLAYTDHGEVPIVHGDGKWVVFESKGAASHLFAPIRVLGIDYADEGYARRDRSGFSEAHGQPGLWAELPGEISPKDPVGQQSREAMAQLRRSRSGALFPAGVKPQWAELTSKTDEVFDRILAYTKKSMASALLGQDGTSGTASVYTAPVFEGVAFAITRRLTSVFGQGVTSGMVMPYVALNAGTEFGAVAPVYAWQLPDLEAASRYDSISKRRGALMSDVRAARENGFDVTQEWVNATAKSYDLDPPTLAGSGGRVHLAWHVDRGVVAPDEVRAGLGHEPLPDGQGSVERLAERHADGDFAPASTRRDATKTDVTEQK